MVDSLVKYFTIYTNAQFLYAIVLFLACMTALFYLSELATFVKSMLGKILFGGLGIFFFLAGVFISYQIVLYFGTLLK